MYIYIFMCMYAYLSLSVSQWFIIFIRFVRSYNQMKLSKDPWFKYDLTGFIPILIELKNNIYNNEKILIRKKNITFFYYHKRELKNPCVRFWNNLLFSGGLIIVKDNKVYSCVLAFGKRERLLIANLENISYKLENTIEQCVL